MPPLAPHSFDLLFSTAHCVVGEPVGELVSPDGLDDGFLDEFEDKEALGTLDGIDDGLLLGSADGLDIGLVDGVLDGPNDGNALGEVDGTDDGLPLGSPEGSDDGGEFECVVEGFVVGQPLY